MAPRTDKDDAFSAALDRMTSRPSSSSQDANVSTESGEDAFTEALNKTLQPGYVPPTPSGAGMAADVGKAAASGVLSGAAGIVDLPGAAINLAGRGAGKLAEWSGRVSPATIQQAESYLPTGTWAQRQLSGLTGGFSEYQPQTTAGRYVKSVGEFVPATVAAALTGGTSLIPTLAAGAVIPGITSEAAGEIAQKYAPGLEAPARIAAAIASGHLSSSAVQKVLPATQATGASQFAQNANKAIQDGTRPSAGLNPHLSVSDIPDHAIPTINGIFDAKGTNPFAAREGIIKAATGMDAVPAALVTDAKVPKSVMPEVQEAVKSGKDALAERFAAMSPPIANPGTELADPLFQAYKNGVQQYNDAYNVARSIPAQFSMPQLPNVQLNSFINNSLAGQGIRRQFVSNSKVYPETNAAISELDDLIKNIANQKGGYINMNELAAQRSALNTRFANATQDDRRGLHAVIDGYDSFIQSLAQRGIGNGDLNSAFNAYKNANGLYRNFQQTFLPDAALAPGVRSVANEFAQVDKAGQTAGMAQNNSIASYVLNPKNGGATYDQFAKAIQQYAPSSLNDFNNAVKANILAPSQTANKFSFAIKPAQMTGLINGVATKVMTPEELKDLKFHLAAQNLLDKKLMAEPSGESLRSIVQSAIVGSMARAGAGALGYYFHEIPGAIAAELLYGVPQRARQAITQARIREKALQGAPSPASISGVLRRVAPYAATQAAMYPSGIGMIPSGESQFRADGGRVERKDGGSVSHDESGDDLVLAAESALKKINKRTEPLLQMPDETVAKALAVANHAIGD